MSRFRDIYRRLSSTYWNIGFVDWPDFDEKSGRVLNIKWLKHDIAGSWFADPFLLSVSDSEIEVLAEEWVDGLRRGRISKLVVDGGDYRLKRAVPLLALDTHLSFPAIIRKGCDVFVYPENYRSGKLSIYKYDRSAEKLVPHSVLCEKPLTDAILVPGGVCGKNMILSTDSGDPNGKKLSVYESEDEFSGYEKTGEFVFGDKIARNAGSIFMKDGEWIRPAQDCNARYGNGLSFQRVFFEGGKISFEEKSRFFTSDKKMDLGIHTFNSLGGRIVVDGCAYRTPFLGSIINKTGLANLMAKLFGGR
ncbi:MAG: hypothetical protein J6P03_00695 [Opitutales bacterium]|nr:hypothetical protein [Opitutales bacterium]